VKIDNFFSELKRRNVYKVQSRLLSRGPSRIKRMPQLFFSKWENGQKD